MVIFLGMTVFSSSVRPVVHAIKYGSHCNALLTRLSRIFGLDIGVTLILQADVRRLLASDYSR